LKTRILETTLDILYEDILGTNWPKERKIVENKYQDIPSINATELAIELLSAFTSF